MAKLIANISMAALIGTGLTVDSIALAGIANVPAEPLAVAVEGEVSWASFDQVDEEYNKIIKRGGTIDQRVRSLKEDNSGTDMQQAARHYLASMLQWRHGELEPALKTVDQALKIGRYGGLLRQKGRLLDVAGRTDEAISSYRDALPLLRGADRQNAELRLAMLQSGDDIRPLLALAERSDAGMKNRVALILAILGHAGEASKLYTLPEGASRAKRLKYQLRIADWALQDLDVLKAQAAAWEAVQLAESREDRLYTLALLTESHRKDDSLDVLVEKLAASKNLSDDARSLWVSLLRETDRAGEALAALKGKAERESAPVKRQLIGVYRESGKVNEMASELKRLMVVDPQETIWPQGLAEYHLEQGDMAAAKRVWKQFIDQNSVPRTLLTSAEVMKKLSFDELALTAAAKAQTDSASIKKAAMFRFELYLERGNQAAAEKVLIDLDNTLIPSDPLRKWVAQCYERLSMPKEALRVMAVFSDSGAEQDTSAKQYLSELQISAAEPAKAVENLLASLPTAAASQRRLIISRIIAAAEKADILDSKTAQLSDRLAKNQLADWEVEFLIEVYSRKKNRQQAIALLEKRYAEAGADKIEGLKKKAQVYRELNDFAAYDKTLAELVKRDPEGAVYHIRARIILYIDVLRLRAKDDREVYTTLTGLLDDYAKVSGKGAAREFQAGVLSMAGQREQALTMFREILAEDPSRVDNYLAIGNQLSAMKRKQQAVAMYQYFVESTERQDILWAAIDGILNMQPGRQALKWAQRLALEKLSASPNRFDFYRQVADLSSDLGELEIQLTTLHHSLSAEPELRMSILRELLRFTGTDDNMVFDQKLLPNAEKHVLFGRRLLALGLALPPDVHISLGKAMLDAGDNQAAVAAVSQAVENTGNITLLIQAAAIFEKANDNLSAQMLYEKALIADPTNIELQLKTARSNERLDKYHRAYALYLAGLTELLDRQPDRLDELVVASDIPGAELTHLDKVLRQEGKEMVSQMNAGATQSRDLRRFYVPLRNGLIRTMDTDSTWKVEALAQLNRAYQEALARVEATAGERPKRLANFPRLNQYAQLIRFINFSYGQWAAANTMDQSLFKLFPKDPLLPEILVSHRLEWGSAGYLEFIRANPEIDSEVKRQVERKLTEAASKTTPGMIAIKSIAGGHSAPSGYEEFKFSDEQIAAKRRLDLAMNNGNQKGMLAAAKRLVDLGIAATALEAVVNDLNRDSRKHLAAYITAGIAKEPAKVAALLSYRGGGFENTPRQLSWLEQLSQWHGKRVASDQQLIKVFELIQTSSGKISREHRTSIDKMAIYKSLSPDARANWLGSYLDRITSNSGGEIERFFSNLMEQPLADDVRDIIMEKLPGFPPMEFVQMDLAYAEIAKENLDIARVWAQTMKRLSDGRLPDPIFEPNLLRCAGDKEGALDKLVEIYFNGTLPLNSSFPAPGKVRGTQELLGLYHFDLIAGNEAELVRKIEAVKVEDSGLKSDKVDWLVSLYRVIYKGRPVAHLRALEKLKSVAPDNLSLLRAQVEMYRFSGDQFALVENQVKTLENIEIQPWDKEGIQSELAALFKSMDNPIEALSMVKKSAQSSVPSRFDLQLPVNVKALRSAFQGDDYSRVRDKMASLMRDIRVTEREPAPDWDERMWPLASLSAVDLAAENEVSLDLLTTLAKHPVGVEVLSNWLRQVRGRFLRQAEGLINALAAAYINQGSAAQKFEQLGHQIERHEAGDKEMALWLALGASQPELATRVDAGGLLDGYLKSDNAFRPTIVEYMARFMVARGDHERARRCYESLVSWMLSTPTQYSPVIDDYSYGQQPNLSELLRNAEKTLEARQYSTLVSKTLLAVKPEKAYLKSLYGKFVLSLLVNANSPLNFYRAGQTTIDQAIEEMSTVEDKDNYDNQLELVRDAYFAIGNRDQALETWFAHVSAQEGTRQRYTWMGEAAPFDDSVQRKVMAFEALLGIEQSRYNVPSAKVFLDPEDYEWLSTVSKTVQGKVDNGQLDREQGIKLLLQVMAAGEQGNADAVVNDMLSYLRKQFSYRSEISGATLAAMFLSAEAVGRPINDPLMEKELLQRGAIPSEYMAGAIERIARREGEREAYMVGKKLLNFTLNDKLISTMIKLADSRGEGNQAQEWRVLQKQAQIARKQLNEMERVQDAP